MLIQLGRESDPLFADQNILPPQAWGVTRGTNRPRWNAALRLYRRDQVVEALEIASDSGGGDRGELVGSLQIIDAEARTSQESIITRVNEWLEVEMIPAQIKLQMSSSDFAKEIGEIAEAAIRKVWAKIGLRIGHDILLSILSEDVVLPSHVDGSGYVTLKKPYAKYCLPASAAQDITVLGVQIQMLAACHAAAVISSSMAPPWLICATEAMTDIAITNEARYGFCSGNTKWLEPGKLNLRLQGKDHEENPVKSATDGLDQAIIVGRYLIEHHGIKAFRDCLSYHSPASAFHYFILLLSGDPTRDACKKLFGFAPEYLFEQALASCCK